MCDTQAARRTATRRIFTCLLLGFFVVPAQAGSDSYPRVDIPAEFADEDAVILRWDQSWSIAEDHSIVQREVKHVLIQNDRAIGAFADPRITYNTDFQSARVLKARTVLPDGRVVEVPDYSRNEVSPYPVAGWPAFSAIRQLVISFGGIEPGAVLELEWERTTAPGMHRWPEIEERLNVQYPTLIRTILAPGAKTPQTWTNLPPMRDEPQSIPWRERCERFSHTTCPSRREWVESVLKQIEIAAEPVAAVKPVAEKWSDGKTDLPDAAYEIQQTLKKRFNFVDVPAGWMPDRLRRVDAVLASRYASAPEAAALLLALFRAVGLEAEPFFVTRDENAGMITAAITDYGVAVKADGGTSYWHASQGRIRDPGPWGGRPRYDRRLIADENARPTIFRSPDGSRLRIHAEIEIDKDAHWTAKLDVRATGLFLPSGSLRTQEQKKSALSQMLDRLLPDARLERFTVATLSDDVFAVSAEAKSKKPLTDLHGDRIMTLPQEGPWTLRFAFPLGRSQRKTAVRLPGPLVQAIKLDFILPDDWSASILPRQVSRTVQDYGTFTQQVEAVENHVTVTRAVEFSRRDISPEVFPDIRNAVNELQTEGARVLVLHPPRGT